MENMTVCIKFQPTILEGQLCYSLDIANLRDSGTPTKSGKQNGLLLLLDPRPYDPYHTDENAASSERGVQNFKVFIHTLHTHTTYGPGSYAMNMLKKMTGTKSFKQLPDYQRRCLDHNREDCQSQKYLDQVQKECKCIPWSLKTNQVMMRFLNLIIFRRISPSVATTKRTVLQTKPWKMKVVWFLVKVSTLI